MKYYTQTIPFSLAEKLKEKGMPMITRPIAEKGKIGMVSFATYASTFDWLIEKGYCVELFYIECEGYWMWRVAQTRDCAKGEKTWHEAANAAIEKALELI